MTIVFPDRGLHLGVLGALLTDGVIAAADLRAVVEPAGPHLAAALELLHSFPVPAVAAAAIEGLDFDGGNEIYLLIEQTLDIDTGGESDDYNVTALDGVLALSGLRSLNLDGHGYHPAPLDLTPLAGHPALAGLVLTGDCTSAGALESLPLLRDLDVTLARLDDPDVTTRLAARGVRIHHR